MDFAQLISDQQDRITKALKTSAPRTDAARALIRSSTGQTTYGQERDAITAQRTNEQSNFVDQLFKIGDHQQTERQLDQRDRAQDFQEANVMWERAQAELSAQGERGRRLWESISTIAKDMQPAQRIDLLRRLNEHETKTGQEITPENFYQVLPVAAEGMNLSEPEEIRYQEIKVGDNIETWAVNKTTGQQLYLVSTAPRNKLVPTPEDQAEATLVGTEVNDAYAFGTTVLESAEASNNSLTTLDAAETLLEEVETGAFQPTVATVQAWAKDLGVDISAVARGMGLKVNDLSQVQTLNAVLSRLVLDEMRGSAARLADTKAEQQRLERAIGSIGNDATALRAILRQVRARLQHNKDRARVHQAAFDEAVSAGGSRSDAYLAAQRAAREWARENRPPAVIPTVNPQADDVPGAIPVVHTTEEWRALEPGSQYQDPQGNIRTKQ